MRRLLVNDCLTCIPGTRTFWHDLQEWTEAEFIGGDYATLDDTVDKATQPTIADPLAQRTSLIIRNATYAPPFKASVQIPTIALLQDIIADGPMREMQEAVIKSSSAIVLGELS